MIKSVYQNSVQIASSINRNAEAEIARIKILLKNKPDENKLSEALTKLEADPAIRQYLTTKTERYLNRLSYTPIGQSGNPDCDKLIFKADPDTIYSVIRIVLEQARASSNPDIIVNALFKPAVLAKLAIVYEHGHFRPQAQTASNVSLELQKRNSNEIAVRETLSLLTEEDAVLRFFKAEAVKADMTGIDLYSKLRTNPKLFAVAAIIHHQTCRELEISPFDTNAQVLTESYRTKIVGQLNLALKSKDNTKAHLKKALSQIGAKQMVNGSSNAMASESLFFQKTLDPYSATISQFLLDAYSRRIKNVEIVVDMLPFDTSKRLPGEFTKQEIARVKKLAEILDLSLTIHSPIVGPCHSKTSFYPLLEDPADNVQLMKHTISLAASIGAKNIVVHLSDRLNQKAIENYAEIALHANGLFTSGGKAVRVAFENYLSKKREDHSRPFPTMEEHLAASEKVLFTLCKKALAANQSPVAALKHVGILLDSAHFNLVSDFNEDPIKAFYDLIEKAPKIGERLLADKEIGPALKKGGFDVKRFCTDLVTELHLNQNIGPIKFIHKHEFSSDIHLPIESSGSILNQALITLLNDAGMGQAEGKSFIITAEQKDSLSQKGLHFIQKAAQSDWDTNLPAGALKVKTLVARGQVFLNWYAQSNPGEYNQMRSLICETNGKPKAHYAYIAGRFDVETLRKHIQQRAYHHIMSAHIDSNWVDSGNKNSLNSPLQDVKLVSYRAGEVIIRNGTSAQEAEINAKDQFYLVISGTAEVAIEGRKIELDAGTVFGEQMLLNQGSRDRDVNAGANALKLLEISRADFNAMLANVPAFSERIIGLDSSRKAIKEII